MTRRGNTFCATNSLNVFHKEYHYEDINYIKNEAATKTEKEIKQNDCKMTNSEIKEAKKEIKI